MEQLITIVILIASIILHEIAHGHMANWLGDPTARLQGRLSPNPVVHIDPLGSIIIPALLIFSQAGFIFGWAKPVPYNPYNLRNQKWGEAMVAVAGPAINILLAIIFAVLIRLADVLSLSPAFLEIASYAVFINLLLAFFNLIPIPPLDGSKILKALLPFSLAIKYQNFIYQFERLGMFATLAFIFLFMWIFWAPFADFLSMLFGLLTGLRLF